ncbi:MAG: MucR family transcriptional regulator [Bacteroidales bacterium]|jgi:hypothetical protein
MNKNSDIKFKNLVYNKDDDKLKCLECGKWYVHLGTHVWRAHGISTRDYKIKFGLNVKQGLISDKMKDLKRKQAFKYKTYENNLVKLGIGTRFKKGEHRVGKYKRSMQTMETIKVLNKLRKTT